MKMAQDETSLQRRVSSRRRRSIEKPQLIADNNLSTTEGRTPNRHHDGNVQMQKRPWIDNSFFSSALEESGVKTKMGKESVNHSKDAHTVSNIQNTPAIPSKSRKRCHSNDHGENRTRTSKCLISCGETSSPRLLAANNKTVQGHDELTSVTSTPKNCRKAQARLLQQVSSSPGCYASQHDSFDENDALFKELDIGSIEEEHYSQKYRKKADLGKIENKDSQSLGLNTLGIDNADGAKSSEQCDIACTEVKIESTTQKVLNSGTTISYHGNKSDTLAQGSSVVHSSLITSTKSSDQTSMPGRNTVGLGFSVKAKLKQNLQRNATSAPPAISKIQQMRTESLQEAMKDASQLRKEGGQFDIGPFYGLPSKVPELLETHRGIKKLYKWQEECLELQAIREGQNLIYSLPTSGGKTLVAEVLLLKTLLCKKKDVIFVMPYVAIVQEKVRNLSTFALELGFLLEEYAGGKGSLPPKKRRAKNSLYIATIEKANALITCLVEENRMGNLGLVVVDELHMLGDGSRGATLEMAITKLLHTSPTTQIVGMSATLNNIGDLKKFLDAEVFCNNFRPVELKEYVKLEDTLYELDGSALCPDDRIKHTRVLTFAYNQERLRKDPDHLTGLVLEVIPEYSCLVFCATKKHCESVAKHLCSTMPRNIAEVKMESKRALIKAIKHEGDGKICPVLRQTVPFGVAYHHSGLTMDERKLIEEAYTEGTLCLLACTSTLAAGVNLPAKRVILRSPYVGTDFMSRSRYKQMVGRAGRAGIDTSGESILILKKHERQKFMDLMGGPYDYCHSSLLSEGNKGARRLLLSTVGLQVTPTSESVLDFLGKSLCAVQQKQLKCDLGEIAKTQLQKLLDLGLITQKRSRSQSDEGSLKTLEVTHLGRAAFKSGLDIDRAPQLYKDLVAGQASLVVSNYLHLLYLVTPYDLAADIRVTWRIYLDQFSSLSSSEVKVAELLGVTESYLTRRFACQRINKPPDEFVTKRFYLTLMLYRLWKQIGIWEVAESFEVSRGFVQNLLSSSASFASCVLHFCEEMEEFWAYKDLLTNFVQRLSYCVTMELIPLMEIPGVKLGRARQLYNSGLRTLQEVAYADPENLIRNIEHMPRKTAKQIVASAKMLLSDKAEALLEEADDLITMPTHLPQDEELVAMGTEESQPICNIIS